MDEKNYTQDSEVNEGWATIWDELDEETLEWEVVVCAVIVAAFCVLSLFNGQREQSGGRYNYALRSQRIYNRWGGAKNGKTKKHSLTRICRVWISFFYLFVFFSFQTLFLSVLVYSIELFLYIAKTQENKK